MLRLPGRESVTICTAELLDEICNEKKFYKYVGGGLLQVRNGLGDGVRFFVSPVQISKLTE